MRHLSEDDLILHYYGESGADIVAAEAHLRDCAQCAQAYGTLTRTLSVVTPPELSEAATGDDDLVAVRARILNSRSNRAQPGLIVLVWLTSLLYPFSLQALFGSAQWAQTHFVGA